MVTSVPEAVTDAYKRLLKPSIETEFAALSKEKADVEAIRIFAENLKQLLLAACTEEIEVTAEEWNSMDEKAQQELLMNWRKLVPTRRVDPR